MSTAEQLLAVAVALAPVLCCVALARPERPGRLAAGGAVASGVLVLVWAWHKAPYEGPAILRVTDDHGLTVVDLVVPVTLAVSAAVLWRHRKG